MLCVWLKNLRLSQSKAYSDPHMSYTQYLLPNLLDMGSLLGTILGPILNYEGSYVHH